MTEDGPFLSSSLPVAGFAIIEARNLDEAVEMVSHSPCAVARASSKSGPLKEHSDPDFDALIRPEAATLDLGRSIPCDRNGAWRVPDADKVR
jgi:hypothetical protein